MLIMIQTITICTCQLSAVASLVSSSGNRRHDWKQSVWMFIHCQNRVGVSRLLEQRTRFLVPLLLLCPCPLVLTSAGTDHHQFV